MLLLITYYETVGGGLSPDKGAVGAKWKVESRKSKVESGGKLALRPMNLPRFCGHEQRSSRSWPRVIYHRF